MGEIIIAEGRTTEEAINNGLKKLNTTKDKVNYKVISEPTKRFFSILTPRVVKVEMSLKNDASGNSIVVSKPNSIAVTKKSDNFSLPSKEDISAVYDRVVEFSLEFGKIFNIKCEHKILDSHIYINLIGDDLGYLIGYRGECLDSIQLIFSTVVNRGVNRYVRIVVDCENYREKRRKTLENLAKKLANTVIKTRKNINLEPMSASDRKIIHSTLQGYDKVKTVSVGEEPNRRVVIMLK